MTRGLRWTAEQVRRAKGGQIDADNELQSAELECGKADALAGRKETQRISQRFSVRCVVTGWKPRDCDRIYIAPILDAFTACRIWPDDKGKFVQKVSFEQTIAEKGEGEETIIIIEEVPEVG